MKKIFLGVGMIALFVLFTGCGKIQERPPRVNQLPAVESEDVGVVVKDGIIYYNRCFTRPSISNYVIILAVLEIALSLFLYLLSILL